MMKKALLFVCLFSLFGCVSTPSSYLEGTSTTLGITVPMNGNLYGCQVLHYLNGCKVNAISNQNLKVTRVYSATNSYFGCVKTIEFTQTQVETK